jgi:hypothetical protein
MGAGADVESLSVIENADFTSMTFGLFAQRSSFGRTRSFIRCWMVMNGIPTAPVAPKLPHPREELVLVEAQILPELDVRHFVQSGALVEPAHLDAEEPRGFVNG